MENTGVSCNVQNCLYNCQNNKCKLDKIEVTCADNCSNDCDTPHFCKSYKNK